jgi:hypothetical protein
MSMEEVGWQRSVVSVLKVHSFCRVSTSQRLRQTFKWSDSFTHQPCRMILLRSNAGSVCEVRTAGR